jgi:hypothetical protein
MGFVAGGQWLFLGAALDGGHWSAYPSEGGSGDSPHRFLAILSSAARPGRARILKLDINANLNSLRPVQPPVLFEAFPPGVLIRMAISRWDK